MSSRRKALVLGSDNGSFLSVIRSLGRAGIEVHIAWCPEDAPAARSRYVHAVHRLPRPSGDGAWLEAFASLMDAERFDLVLPTNDPTLIPLQLARQELEPRGRMYLLNDRAFGITFDKVRTRELALAQGVPVAPGAIVSTDREIASAIDGRSYPLIVKPQASFSLDDLERRNSVVRVYDEAAAHAAIRERLPHGRVLIEDNVPGTGWGVEVLAHDGEILLSQQHERLHEPLHGGQSSYRRTVPRHPAFLRAATTLIRALAYTGVAMFEFKGDPSSGEWILVEINGRFWGSLPLSLAAGIDFPYALWQLLVDGHTDVANDYRTGIYARNLKRDLKWQWLNLRSDRHDPDLSTMPLGRVLAELGHVARGREHTDQFITDDLRPGVAEFRGLALDLADNLRTRAVAATPARGLHRRRADASLRRARTVLFVCYGNICRSPFAAAVAERSLQPSVTVLSAGTAGQDGRPSPSVARAAATAFGVSLDSHRSRSVTPELVDGADAIFVFDEHNAGEMRRRFPQARQRLHLLGALTDGPLVIADPINGGDQAFHDAYARIVQALHGNHAGGS